jgi:hypothetical protein
MDYKTFKKMEDVDKMKHISEAGVRIAERNYKCFRIELYQVGNYYHLDTIQLVWPFDHLDDLEPYLQQIDLSLLQFHLGFHNN